jgi:hypothetical protein
VQISHAIRTSLSRATFDTRRWRATGDDEALARLPQHIVLELNTARTSTGLFAQSLNPTSASRESISLDLAERLFSELASQGTDDVVVTLHGAGDPLLHRRFDDIVLCARKCGMRAVSLRTELLVETDVTDRLLASGVDVVGVDLNADRAATYLAMMGADRFRDALMNIEHLIGNRRHLTAPAGSAAMALPWVVPHLQRRAETYEDIDSFFDRWQHMLGTCVIDDPPATDRRPIGLTPAITPTRVAQRDASRRMTILCDGRVPLRDVDFTGDDCIGNVIDTPVLHLWRTLSQQRAAAAREHTS